MAKKEATAKEEAKEVRQWDLTDEEAEAYYDWGFQLSVKEKPTASWFIHEAAGRRAIALGEARKLVEWLEKEMSDAPAGRRLSALERCLITIRKDLGLETPQ